MNTYEVTRGPLCDCLTRIMTLSQHWRHMNLSRNSFPCPAKGYRHVISNCLYVILIGTCSLSGRARLNTGE